MLGRLGIHLITAIYSQWVLAASSKSPLCVWMESAEFGGGSCIHTPAGQTAQISLLSAERQILHLKVLQVFFGSAWRSELDCVNYGGDKCHFHLQTLLKPDQNSVLHWFSTSSSSHAGFMCSGYPNLPCEAAVCPLRRHHGQHHCSTTSWAFGPPLRLPNPPKKLHLQSHPCQCDEWKATP